MPPAASIRLRGRQQPGTYGLAGLHNGRRTEAALLVAIGAPKLRSLGLDVPDGPANAEHLLYDKLASPDDFIPVRAGRPDRSPFIAQVGPLAFHHFDFCPQALAKIERGHAQQVTDVREMLNRCLITPECCSTRSTTSSRSCIAIRQSTRIISASTSRP